MRKFLCCAPLLFVILSLCACGGLHTRWEISTKDCCTGENFKVQMWVRNSNVAPQNHFTIDENIDEFKQLLDKKGLHVEKYREEYLYLDAGQPFLIKETELVQEDSGSGHRYILFAPTVTIAAEGHSPAFFHLPYHLLDGIDGVDSETVDSPVSCMTTADLKQLEEFYRAFECYETRIENGVLYVSNSDTDQQFKITINGTEVSFWVDAK